MGVVDLKSNNGVCMALSEKAYMTSRTTVRDAAAEINEEPPLIILWTRRSLDISIDTPDHHQRPRQKPKYDVAHREHDKPP
jgi:hypothetical protein